MYRNCIFCSAALGSNDAVERFPVGRTLAFDGAKGRLWAVCRRCARWNLAPLEERWEAIEDAERLFRDTRLRVQSENIGVATLRDGTRLIRVGEALPGELAVWRYGQAMARRRRQYWALTAGSVAATGATFGVLLATTGFHFWALGAFTNSGRSSSTGWRSGGSWAGWRTDRPRARCCAGTGCARGWCNPPSAEMDWCCAFRARPGRAFRAPPPPRAASPRW